MSILDQHITMQSTARTGKSYEMLKKLSEQMTDERVVYFSSAHSEAKEQLKKLRHEFGIDACYLIGQERARNEYDLSTTGDVTNSFRPHTPEEAKQRDDVNQYQCLVAAAADAQVVVTVPELKDKLGDRDMVIMTEEAAFSRMMAQGIGLVSVERVKGNDRSISSELLDMEDKLQGILDEIDDLEQRDHIHTVIRTAIRTLLDICNIIDEWRPSHYQEGKDNWDVLKEDVTERLNQMAFERMPTFNELYTRLQNYNRVDKLLLNTIYWEGRVHDRPGIFDYADGNKLSMFYLGDVERPMAPLWDDATYWLAGNSVPSMQWFHEVVHGAPPTPFKFADDECYTPVFDSIKIVKYTGRTNLNQQSSDVQQIQEEIQKLTQDNISSLLVSGSSRHTAQHAERIRKCIVPSQQDDVDALHDYADAGLTVAIPENSRFSEGVDTPCFDMGALYNGQFATPVEDYIKEYGWNLDMHAASLKKGEKMRAAQNSILRTSDVPDGEGGTEGTGITPVIVPDKHVPDEIWDLFEEFGVDVVETDDPTEARRIIIKVLDMNAEEYDGRIVDPDEAPDALHAFDKLRQSSRGVGSEDGTAD